MKNDLAMIGSVDLAIRHTAMPIRTEPVMLITNVPIGKKESNLELRKLPIQ